MQPIQGAYRDFPLSSRNPPETGCGFRHAILALRHRNGLWFAVIAVVENCVYDDLHILLSYSRKIKTMFVIKDVIVYIVTHIDRAGGSISLET